ncbi:FMN-binding negative transcriptional regulator [Lysobacter solisilvae (ex Woo and Kim 2020)]|uniref:FMN-binding negative transcriptional regulator n=1 Tax=Agrilutibacter terrestris TaxID=2865112 RepID=A0A7H0FXP0_9GAMM|nr:FMN-binding negative transcriptional regulator [Lysobacter terrestris]QNP40806.1 FMN-binding negative transcriptional regulator [Lysobacter terrestris]
MYRPAAFVETDLAALDALIERDNFITLITVRDGAPVVNHLPVLYRRDGDRIELRGHWARPNPQARHAGPATAIVHGPHAYVSPSWYPDKEAEARVPTWNYAVAHLGGTLETFDDEAALAAIVDELSQQHEARAGHAWRFEFERPDHRVQLRGIVGFRFHVDDAVLKFKLNQNHPAANRSAVADQLEQQARDDSRDIAALMRARTPTEN